MVLILKKYVNYKCLACVLLVVVCSAINNVKADIYMDFTDTLLSTSELLGANSKQSRQRYIILNGVPITTSIYKVNFKHNRAIEKISNTLDINNIKTEHNSNKNQPFSLEPTVIVTKDWSAIYSVKLENDELVALDKKRVGENYVTLAKKLSSNQSMMVELVFENANDMKNLLFSREEDVKCDEILNMQRYPNSRRKFCLTEITRDKIVSQIVIFEGYGDPVTRVTHYQNELSDLDYQLDAVDKESSDKAILFASNDLSNTTIFTYKSNNKVLDVIQVDF